MQKTAEDLTIELNESDFEYIEACHKEITELKLDKEVKEALIEYQKELLNQDIEQRR